eukprot:1155326-Pelagomonas_calceolata.AAC.5
MNKKGRDCADQLARVPTFSEPAEALRIRPSMRAPSGGWEKGVSFFIPGQNQVQEQHRRRNGVRWSSGFNGACQKCVVPTHTYDIIVMNISR